jgi:hypothetical protein
MWSDVFEKTLDTLSAISGVVLLLLALPLVTLVVLIYLGRPPHLWEAQAVRLMNDCSNFSQQNGRQRDIVSVDSIRGFDSLSPNQKNMEFDWRWHDAANSPGTRGFARLDYRDKRWSVEFFSDDLKGPPQSKGCSDQSVTNSKW